MIEDAPVGVVGAKRAGATCLAVTSTRLAEALWNAGADRVVSSLQNITPGDLDSLIRASASKASRGGIVP